MNNGVNLHVYQSTLTHESRLLRITKTIAETGLFDRIRIVGRHDPGLEEKETIDEVRQICRVRTKWVGRYSGPWKILANLEWTLRILWNYRRVPVACVNCHSLVVLPLCVLLKWQHGSKLVYDTHELETETSTSTGIRKRLAKLIERRLIRFADAVITVTDSIGRWYKREYGLEDVAVVRNTPLRPEAKIAKSSALKEKLGIPAQKPLFIYLGSLGFERGIERLLRVFSLIDDKHVVFVGFGPLVDEAKRYAARHDNIHFHEAVPTSQIAEIASGADVGLALLENSSLNHFYCLGNKVFEYLMCGLPVIVSDFPEMGGIVTNYNCGWRVDPDDDSCIAELLSRIEPPEIHQKAENAKTCRLHLVWENEEPQLLAVYNKLYARAS